MRQKLAKQPQPQVLIESDWNLKGQRRTDSCGCRTGINRIRLEFKVRFLLRGNSVIDVLIESDWNLKYKDTASAFPTGKSINRIRLEFKGCRSPERKRSTVRINRIRLEFKAYQLKS